jgi:hypothetical protein
MKNQSFHPRKIRLPETPDLDYGQLRSRTIIALSKLGRQKFSAEPGGYSLENWMRGVNILLDEFEGKMGKERLPADYFAKRRELNDRLSGPVSTSSIDTDIFGLRHDMADVRAGIEEGRERIASRLVELKSEQGRCSAELVQERERISNLVAGQNSGSFLRRIFVGKSKTPTEDSGDRVKVLESRLDTLSNEILEQQKLLKLVDRHSPESPLAEEWKALESLEARLEALENARLERLQLVKERETITASIVDTLSGMSF